MPWIDSYWVSRMRENRTSGLRRGEAAATLPLSYSTQFFLRPYGSAAFSYRAWCARIAQPTLNSRAGRSKSFSRNPRPLKIFFARASNSKPFSSA